MLHLIDAILWLAVLTVCLPIAVLFVECVASALPRRRGCMATPPRPRIAMLVPAHDEELLIGKTVRSLRQAMIEGDRLVVIADNCTDATAQIAAAEGATVLKRTDAIHRGKGFALSFGLDSLRSAPPEAVIIFDADCPVELVTVDTLAREVARCNTPVQCRYVLSAPAGAGVRGVVSSLAFVVKNVVRPAGMRAMGFPCPLLGTGMAFPWSTIANARIGGGHLVEDMQLGVDLLLDGHATLFCEDAAIDGDLPDRTDVALEQRTRWEHGHLGVIRTACLPLLKSGLVRGKPVLLAAALDLCIPPLALLSLSWIGVTLIAALGTVAGAARGPAMLASVGGAMLMASVLIAWARSGRHIPLRALGAVPLYVLWKVPLYLKWMVNPQKKWVRTQRAVVAPAMAGGSDHA